MGKIEDKGKYPDKTPEADDYFIGTNATTKETVTFTFEGTAEYVAEKNNGWMRYDDSEYTNSTSPLTVLSGNTIKLPNNGDTTVEHASEQYYDVSSQKVIMSTENSVYVMTLAFQAETSADGGSFDIEFYNPNNPDYSRISETLHFAKGKNVWHNFHEVYQFYADGDIVDSGLEIKVTSNGADTDIKNVIYFIQKTQ